VNLGNRGILFEQRKTQNALKKLHGSWRWLRECVVHPMIFFRGLGVFRCKRMPLSPSFIDLLHFRLYGLIFALEGVLL